MRLGLVTVSFNQAGYLQEAIDSVAVSSRHSLSWVIVDPGSTDASRGIIARNRGRFAKIILKPDSGPADGLNKGFAACDADVYGYLNSDDRLVPGALDFVAAYFERNEDIDLLFGAIRIIDAGGKPRLRGRAPDRIDLNKFANGACFAWQQGTFFRRELFERTPGFNPSNRICWDAELVLDMLLAGGRPGYTNTILGDFRIHATSITGSRGLVELEQPRLALFRRKLLSTGLRPLSPAAAKFARLKYKYDPIRHLNCLWGIRLPEVY